MFVHLHVHSNYSFCRGADRLETIVIAARQRGYESLALTDTNGLYGLVWFLDAAREAGIRPIVGAEAVYGEERAVVLVKDRDGYAGLCRLLTRVHRALSAPVRGSCGFLHTKTAGAAAEGEGAGRERVGRRVYERDGVGGDSRGEDPLVSSRGGGGKSLVPHGFRTGASRSDHEAGDRPLRREGLFERREYGRAQGPDAVDPGEIDQDDFNDDGEALPPVEITARPPRRAPDPSFSLTAALAELPTGVVILSPCRNVLSRLARERGPRDLYVELRPGSPPGLKEFARVTGLQPVATGGVHFVDRDGRTRHHLLRAIALNTSIDRVPASELAPADAFLASPREMERRFPDLPRALEASVRISEECTFSPEMGRAIFPVYETLEGTRLTGTEIVGYLERECREGIRRRYGSITPAAEQRLARELGIIRDKGFAPYFLVVRDIVRQAPRTCGRGSAAASLVSYALGITHVDPIRYDLFFDRFLNPGRVDPPDIDVDFPWDERDRLLEWVFARFGRRRAAMIANHNTFQMRAAVREIAKVRGLPDAEIGRISKKIPWYSSSEDPEALVRSHPIFKDVELSEPWPSILRAARDIDGFPRHLSVHCGGVVLVPDAIDRYVPVQPAAKGVDVVQWEKDQSEAFGLVKIDLLGNRSLAVIRDACASIAERGGPRITFERFQPLNDEPTKRLLARGETVGVFYVESPAMRQLQTKCGTGEFERLVVHSSIIRPATNEYIREYVRRLKGGVYRTLHPVLDDIMRESFGIMVYQEDVAKTAIALAGFDAAAADDLRKVLSRKHKERRLADYRKRFFEGAAERGYDIEVVDQVWRMILSFAGYSFCKPHSASYALVSFKSAWLRAHYPAEFLAGVISNGGGYYSTFAYISEARRMGLQVLLPDVNESEKGYTGRTWKVDPRAGMEFEDASTSEAFPPSPVGVVGIGTGSRRPFGASSETSVAGDRDESRPTLYRGAIRTGLQQLKSFPAAAVEALLDERRGGGPFRSFEDFLERVGARIGPSAVKILVRSGAFDAIGGGLDSRPALMWRLAAWQRSQERRSSKGRPLWDLDETVRLPTRVAPYRDDDVLRQEIDALGFLISRHPLSLFEREIEALRRTSRPPLVHAQDLPQRAGQVVRLVGWFVTAKTVHTKTGEPMEFLSFEDTTALYETTFFPRTYARFCHMMSHDRPYIVRGRVEEDEGAFSVNVSDVAFLASTATARLSDGRRGAGHGSHRGSLAPAGPSHHGGTGPNWSKLIEGG